MYRRSVLAGIAGLLLPPGLAGCARQDTKPADEASTASKPTAPGLDSPIASAPSADGRATAADYAELVSDGTLGPVYALTWLEGLSPEEIADRYRVRRRLGHRRWPEGNWSDLPGIRRDEATVAITRVSGWTLSYQEQPSYSQDDALLRQLSKGTRGVAIYHNFEADDRFTVAQDGTVQTDFDPNLPTTRAGRRPDMLVPDMQAAGFDLSGSNPEPGDPAYRDVPPDELALALAEHVTGIRLTLSLLHTSTYLAATVTSRTAGSVTNEAPEIRTAAP